MLLSSIQLTDHPTPEALVTVIKNRVLAGGDARFGRVHQNLEPTVINGPQPATDQRWGVAHPKIETVLLRWFCDPMRMGDGEAISVVIRKRISVDYE